MSFVFIDFQRNSGPRYTLFADAPTARSSAARVPRRSASKPSSDVTRIDPHLQSVSFIRQRSRALANDLLHLAAYLGHDIWCSKILLYSRKEAGLDDLALYAHVARANARQCVRSEGLGRYVRRGLNAASAKSSARKPKIPV